MLQSKPTFFSWELFSTGNHLLFWFFFSRSLKKFFETLSDTELQATFQKEATLQVAVFKHYSFLTRFWSIGFLIWMTFRSRVSLWISSTMCSSSNSKGACVLSRGSFFAGKNTALNFTQHFKRDERMPSVQEYWLVRKQCKRNIPSDKMSPKSKLTQSQPSTIFHVVLSLPHGSFNFHMQ